MSDPKKTQTARIEVFRPGTFTPMQGGALTYSASDLKAIADAYDPDTAPAPIVVGHPDVDAPAYGWVTGFDYDANEERLYARVGEIDPAFAALVKAGRFKKVSLAYFAPGHAANPVPGTWYPKHLGFLGAAAPGVPGLKNAKFSIPQSEAVTFEVAFGVGSETAGVLRLLRELLIERFGREDADAAIPAWRIDWIEAADDPPEPAPHFAAPPAPEPPTPEPKEPAVTQPDPAFAAREAELTTREAALAAREQASRHAENAAFAAALVADGKLLPVSAARVVAILDALPGEASVSFAAGEAAQTPAEALKAVLSEQPKSVQFGALDLGKGPGASAGAPAFAADGNPVDRDELAVDAKARAFMSNHPGTSYLDAVRAVS